MLQRARDGFAALGASWERARTELDMGEALSAVGRSEDPGPLVDAAEPDLERAGAIIEVDRMRAVRERLR